MAQTKAKDRQTVETLQRGLSGLDIQLELDVALVLAVILVAVGVSGVVVAGPLVTDYQRLTSLRRMARSFVSTWRLRFSLP